jgi:RND family efflux transporter MFP subunit
LPLHETKDVGSIENFADIVTATGRLRSATQAFVSIRNGGSLDALHVKAGDLVKKGQILAVIDKETRTANLERALSNFKLAKAEHRRIRRLFRNGSTTRSEMDKTEANLSIREAELKVAREELNDALVRSPIDGKVTYFAFKLDDTIPDGSRIAVVEDPEQLEVRVKVSFSDVGKVASQNEVEIARYDLSKRMATGEKTAIKASITQIQQKSDYDSAYGELSVLMENPAGYGVGELVHLTLYNKTYPKLWSIPNEAILVQGGKEWIVTKDDSNDLNKQEIDIIASKAGQSYILPFSDEKKLITPEKGTSWQAFLSNQKIKQLL